MAAMYGLGRVYNVIAVADNVHVPLRAGTGVAFVIYEDGGDTQATIQEGVNGATAQDLACVDTVYTSNGIGGVWSKNTIAVPLALIQKKDFPPGDDTAPTDCCIVEVLASQLSDGYDTVACNVDAGTVVAILFDLRVARAPQNLPALVS